MLSLRSIREGRTGVNTRIRSLYTRHSLTAPVMDSVRAGPAGGAETGPETGSGRSGGGSTRDWFGNNWSWRRWESDIGIRQWLFIVEEV